mmetsp:Transcript_14023/g.38757  ORF Transcript_14023/g.38757 Transcript_14023/m.38757 type:complete len:295 (-) Transcript_14023:1990-2874(-)
MYVLAVVLFILIGVCLILSISVACNSCGGRETNLGQSCLLWIPALLSTGAFCCSMVASFWCETIQFEPNSNLQDEGFPDIQLDSLHFGPWYQLEVRVENIDIGGNTKVTTIQDCVDWETDPDPDSTWKTVRAFTIIVAILGGFATVALWFVPCVRGRITAALWQAVAGCLYVVTLTLFQGLTFLIFRSNVCEDNSVAQALNKLLQLRADTDEDFYEDECSWDEGSSANVAAIVAWFFAGISMLLFNGPPQDDEDDYSSDEEEAEDNAEDTVEKRANETEEKDGIEGEEEPVITA